MMRRRLAIFSPGGIGGGAFTQGQPALGNLVARLAELFEVTFYSLGRVDPGFAPVGYSLRQPTSAVATIPVKGLRWADLARQFLAEHLRRPFERVLSLWGYPMGTFALALARLARAPAGVMLLGAETAYVPSIGYGHFGGGASRHLVLETCRRADALVAVSRHQLRALSSRGVSREDARVVPIGAEAELFPFEEKRRGPPLKIIHVGNLTAVKDQETLLRAFARVRAAVDARLRIVGDGQLRPRLQELIRELGIGAAVEMTGAVPFSDMPAHYRWADMCVLTSLSEGQNRSLTEAAMSGVLQVSTPVGHMADVGEEMAVIVKIGDPQDIADRVLAIAGDTVGWERRVRAARSWAVDHDMGWTCERMTEIIEGMGRR
jgi:glycosyltransferase involved in cell wall biosynthesis